MRGKFCVRSTISDDGLALEVVKTVVKKTIAVIPCACSPYSVATAGGKFDSERKEIHLLAIVELLS
jgi:hypothetical protein